MERKYIIVKDPCLQVVRRAIRDWVHSLNIRTLHLETNSLFPSLWELPIFEGQELELRKVTKLSKLERTRLDAHANYLGIGIEVALETNNNRRGLAQSQNKREFLKAAMAPFSCMIVMIDARTEKNLFEPLNEDDRHYPKPFREAFWAACREAADCTASDHKPHPCYVYYFWLDCNHGDFNEILWRLDPP